MASGVFAYWVCNLNVSRALTSADVLIAQTDHIFAKNPRFVLFFIRVVLFVFFFFSSGHGEKR